VTPANDNEALHAKCRELFDYIGIVGNGIPYPELMVHAMELIGEIRFRAEAAERVVKALEEKSSELEAMSASCGADAQDLCGCLGCSLSGALESYYEEIDE